MNDKNEIESMDVVEVNELKVGSNFHAFRFSEAVEEISLIEEEELKVGSNFHAFRFSEAVEA